MGQQQLLLIVLGIIVVGIAVILGITLFKTSAVEAKRDNMINEAFNLASMAQQYYQRPRSLLGGGRKFTDWKIPADLVVTASGRYEAVVNADDIVITGIGNDVVTGNDSVSISVTVTPKTIQTAIIH
ncbi:MAG: hypothetical protein HND52_04645 [Ignavibacteriae bacterium]|nr:hypothetical protein [Ignavibacteriota bacterium]NOG97247.1 hypothetical protein [Ignavibacteriota bacterium]